jgi:hypothetical protein
MCNQQCRSGMEGEGCVGVRVQGSRHVGGAIKNCTHHNANPLLFKLLRVSLTL